MVFVSFKSLLLLLATAFGFVFGFCFSTAKKENVKYVPRDCGLLYDQLLPTSYPIKSMS